MRKILYLVPATFEELKKKGVASLIFEKDEFGFFDYVYTVHFPAPKTTIIRMSERNLIYEYAEDFCPWLEDMGLRLGHKLANIFFSLFRIYSLIKKEKINIIRANDPFQKGLYAYILSKLTGIPFCVSIHADYDKRWELSGPACGATILGSNKIANLVARFVLSKSKIVMPIRDSLARYAIKHGARPETIRVIPHGINLKPFLEPANVILKKDYGLEGKKIVVFAGRLSRENYVYDILEAAKRVCQTRDDVIFVLLGGGDEDENLRKKAREYKIENAIKFLGFQSYDKVIEFRKNADVNLCLMGGYSLIEACASGNPVIAYDVEWHSELIEDGKTGFLVHEGDIDKVSDKILFLLDNRAIAVSIGKAAREVAFKRHSHSKTSLNKVNVYREMLGMTGDK